MNSIVLMKYLKSKFLTTDQRQSEDSGSSIYPSGIRNNMKKPMLRYIIVTLQNAKCRDKVLKISEREI